MYAPEISNDQPLLTDAGPRVVMNLLLLAPDIQEAILCLPPTDGRRAPIRERRIRPICAILDWRKQRRLWDGLVGRRDSGTSDTPRRSAC